MNLKRKTTALMSMTLSILLTFGTPVTSVFAASNSTNGVFQPTKQEIKRIYSSNSSPEEKRKFINSRINSGSSDIDKTTITEFDLCKATDKVNNITPDKENSRVRQYLKKIKDLSKKGDAELKSEGINSKRINAIKGAQSNSFNPNDSIVTPFEETVAIASSATLSLDKSIDGYYYNESDGYSTRIYKTLAFATIHWSWNQSPLNTWTDGFAASWYASTGLLLERVFAGVDYYRSNTGEFAAEASYDDQAFNNRTSGLDGLDFNFPEAINGNDITHAYDYAGAGYCMVELVSTDYQVSAFTLHSVYAHSYSALVPSFVLSPSGISLTAAYKIVSEPTYMTWNIYK